MKGLPKWVQERIDITKERKLKTLALSSRLITIPDEIFELTWPETLDLGNNHFTEIPDAITKLTKLHTLYL